MPRSRARSRISLQVLGARAFASHLLLLPHPQSLQALPTPGGLRPLLPGGEGEVKRRVSVSRSTSCKFPPCSLRSTMNVASLSCLRRSQLLSSVRLTGTQGQLLERSADSSQVLPSPPGDVATRRDSDARAEFIPPRVHGPT